MTFVPHTAAQRAQMLAACGVKNFEELLERIPPQLLLKRGLNVPPVHGEVELAQAVRQVLAETQQIPLHRVFAGGGVYPHHVPAVVDELGRRGEFYTAYTPYQPEVSQGMLQCIYEYQSYICLLTGMDIANASGYDLGTTLADAIGMVKSYFKGKRTRILFAPHVNPEAREVADTYNIGFELDYTDIPDCERTGTVRRNIIAGQLDASVGAVVFQYPDYLGYLDDGLAEVINWVHEAGALAIVVFYPFAAGLLKTPGELGADIVVGEAQCLGNYMGFGGPLLGFVACREQYVRVLPGRLIGRTSCERRDSPSEPFSPGEGFVMTLQAREQHIRRDKALSNICSNEALLALRACLYMGAIGREGFSRIAETCHCNAVMAHTKLAAIPGVEDYYPSRGYFNEFTLKLDPAKREAVYALALERGMLAGLRHPQLADALILAFTEVHHERDIIELAAVFQEVLG
jgi:glycine dehydrogenase subunit 1